MENILSHYMAILYGLMGFDDIDKFQTKSVIRSRGDCLLKTQNIRAGIHVSTSRKFVIDDRSIHIVIGKECILVHMFYRCV
ncbi:unnamed protein product [Wuchereria bancrofti]|uniref:Uncharacterized protein n=1 Tax=Wuchereria bancrofti TaxID=6293 RepID=A0A3P7GBK0_WUCBA|nr:unnamed protein product [Wuchereria bancrofti]